VPARVGVTEFFPNWFSSGRFQLSTKWWTYRASHRYHGPCPCHRLEDASLQEQDADFFLIPREHPQSPTASASPMMPLCPPSCLPPTPSRRSVPSPTLLPDAPLLLLGLHAAFFSRHPLARTHVQWYLVAPPCGNKDEAHPGILDPVRALGCVQVYLRSSACIRGLVAAPSHSYTSPSRSRRQRMGTDRSPVTARLGCLRALASEWRFHWRNESVPLLAARHQPSSSTCLPLVALLRQDSDWGRWSAALPHCPSRRVSAGCSVRSVRKGHGMTLEEKTETVRHLWMARWVISLNGTKAYFKLVENVFSFVARPFVRRFSKLHEVGLAQWPVRPTRREG
jgi:hypothetical protein